MRRSRRYSRLPAVAALLAALVPGQAFAALATHSFTNHANGTHPGALTLSAGVITVDLSAIPGAVVHRATLDPGVAFDHIDVTANALAETSMRITLAGEPLATVGPRHGTFDATAAVRGALAGGGPLVLAVEDDGPGFGSRISLDVLCDVEHPGAIAPVTGTAARFEGGDAMITFTEPDPLFAGDSVACSDFYTATQTMDDAHKVRFRIYRSGIPLTSEAALAAADLVDEIKPLSGWNPRFPGPGGDCYPTYGGGTVYTLPIEDLVHADGSTGIYVDSFRGSAPDTAYYFVSRTVDGAEGFSVLQEGLNASGAVVRAPGSGMVLLNKVEHETEFNYGASAGQYYYVKWEAPPASSFPNSAYNYVVAVPSAGFAVAEPGVDLALHCWGGDLTGGYGWWYFYEQGHLLVAGNQFPFQDWWTGYHENLGTLKGWGDGAVKPFTMHRLLAFIFDFVAPAYHADTDRIVLSGSSMGGAGASLAGIRNGHIFSHLISWVGVHVPRESPTFASSFERAWGDVEWNARFSNEEFARRFGGQVVHPGDGYGVWDYYDNEQWLRANPAVEVPWLTYSNGENDDDIGWGQALSFTQALMDTRRPFNFQWGTQGHSQRVALLDPYGYDKTQKSHLVFSLDQSFPVFLNASSDADPTADPEGKINAYGSWDTGEVADEAGRWAVTLFIPDAPGDGPYSEVFPDSLTADVAPARLQHFAVEPDSLYAWEWTAADGALLQAGRIAADSSGRILVPRLTIRKDERRRLTIEPAAADSTSVSVTGHEDPIPPVISGLEFPNPFRPAMSVVFHLAKAAPVHLTVHDVSGRTVRALAGGDLPAGPHAVGWDGRDDRGNPAPSGTYFLRLDSGGAPEVRKITLLR